VTGGFISNGKNDRPLKMTKVTTVSTGLTCAGGMPTIALLMRARIVIAILAAVIATPAVAQDAATRGSELRVYLMTLGPGSLIYERFGHNLIVIHNPNPTPERVAEREQFEVDHGRFKPVPLLSPTDRAYHYGAFNFGGDFLPRFVMGRMRYWMAYDWADYIALVYGIIDKRHVRLQELDLTAAQKLSLQDFLENNAKEENKYYRYDYYRDNCSTRVRDALDNALGGDLNRQFSAIPTKTTYRSHTRRLTSGLDPLDLFWFTSFTYVEGHPVDQPLSAWEECFLPDELAAHIANVRLSDGAGGSKPLVIDDRVLFDPSQSPLPAQSPRRIPAYFVAGLLLCGTFASLARAAVKSRIARIAFILLTVPWAMIWSIGGSIAAGAWIFTDHAASYRNENLLQASPLFLPLVLLAPIVASGRRWGAKFAARLCVLIAGLSVFGFVLQALPPFWQHNGEIIALMVPSNLGLAFAMMLFWKQVQAKTVLETRQVKHHEQAASH
jgi:hypothetical protein